MKHLYILCEGWRDEVFYKRICERVTGQEYEEQRELRLRHGSNWKSAMANAKLLLGRYKHIRGQQDICAIIAIDNDRAPAHPGAKPPSRTLPKSDLKKQPRHPALVQMVEGFLGADRTKWPIDVALAVPVEMIESWVLLLWNPDRPDLPLFSEASQPSAREYHGGHARPQLKDLCKAEAETKNLTLDTFFTESTDKDLANATAASASLNMFIEELRQWRKPPN